MLLADLDKFAKDVGMKPKKKQYLLSADVFSGLFAPAIKS